MKSVCSMVLTGLACWGLVGCGDDTGGDSVGGGGGGGGGDAGSGGGAVQGSGGQGSVGQGGSSSSGQGGASASATAQEAIEAYCSAVGACTPEDETFHAECVAQGAAETPADPVCEAAFIAAIDCYAGAYDCDDATATTAACTVTDAALEACDGG